MNERSALLSLHLGAVFFGLAGVLGKLSGATSTMIVFGRCFFAVIALMMFLAFTRSKWHKISITGLLRLLVSGVLLAAHWLTFFLAITTGGVALATLGFSSFPAFTVILESLLFRERVSTKELTILVLVTAGLVMVAPSFSIASGSTEGLLWGVLSGLLFALLAISNRISAISLPAVQTALCQNFIVAALLLPMALPSLTDTQPITWLWLALLGIFCTGLAHTLFVMSLAHIKARVAALVFSLEPIYGILFAWLIFNETPNTNMIIGGSMILAAVLATALKSTNQSHGTPAKTTEISD